MTTRSKWIRERSKWISETTISHLIMMARIWPWVCAASFVTLASADQWTPRILALLAWPFPSMFYSLFGIIIMKLISRAHQKPMPLILWGYFIVCDFGCIVAIIYHSLDPRRPFYPP